MVLPCSNHSINNASKLTDNMGIDSTARPTCGLTQIYTELGELEEKGRESLMNRNV